MKKALSVFGRAFMVALALVFVSGLVSCKESDDEEEEYIPILPYSPGSVLGTWKSAKGDSYVFTENTFVNYMYDGAKAEYTLNLVDAAEVEGTENPTYYLYYKAPETSSYSGSYVDGEGVTQTYSGTYYTKDYYTAVRVIVKSATVLDISTACNASYKTEDASLATVKSDFTIANGFFGSNIEYTKQ